MVISKNCALDTRPSDIIMRVRYSLKIKKNSFSPYRASLFTPYSRILWLRMAATHPKNWRVDPTKYTYQTDSLFTNFHPLLERWNPDIRSYDRYIHLMHAESLLRIKTEMTSTQRRDNLNIIYNHAKLMHFYMLI